MIGGAFLGGGVEVVPAGSCKIVLELRTEGGKNLTSGFSVSGGGNTYTATAGADGRAELTVPSGVAYSVSCNATGYDGLNTQTVVAESATVKYVRFEAILPRVLKSGDTMTGNLFIHRTLPAINLKMDNLLLTERPTSTQYVASIGILDRTDATTFAGGMRYRWTTDGTHRIGLEAVGEDKTVHGLYVFANPDGTAYVTAPSWSVGTNDNSDKILTIKMANSLPSLVHTTGNETISGAKVFSGSLTRTSNIDPMISVKNTEFVLGTTPSESTNLCRYLGVDKNGKITSALISRAYANGINATFIESHGGDGSATGILGVYTKLDGTSYATAPSTPSTATSNEIATADWTIGKFVQKSGDTMTGNLFIEASSNRFVYIKRTDLGRDVEQVFPTSGTTTVGGFIIVDKDGGAIGGMNRAVSPSEVSVTLQNSQTVNGTLRHCNLSLKIAKDGSMYATVPTPSDSSDNSTKIATTSWVNSASTVVHTTGNEDLSGDKRFTAGSIIKSTDAEVGVTPSSEKFKRFTWVDKNNVPLGLIQFTQRTNGTMSVEHFLNNGTSNVWGLSLNLLSDGSVSTRAPSTPSTATENEIATANWVNGKLAGRVQKLPLNGTLTGGEIVTTDIQANDTVVVSITSEGIVTPATFMVNIPSTVENATAVRSSSHVLTQSDGKPYSIDIFVQYRKSAWYISTVKHALSNGAVTDSEIESFYGHILREG